jgi:transcriptional regulator with XRE-family HTH domain
MPRADANTTWASWLNAALTHAEMTQADLERATGFPSGTISRWVRGTFSPTDPETVIAVAHAVRARDAVAALDAAGLTGTASLIRSVRTEQGTDPMLLRIRTDRMLTAEQRADLEQSYLRRQAETLHDFELRLADAQGRSRRSAAAAAPPHARAGRAISPWAAFLEQALADARMTPAEVAARSERTIPEAAITAWIAGAAAPTAMEAVFTARILGADEVEALRAARYPREAAEADRLRKADPDAEEDRGRNGRAS